MKHIQTIDIHPSSKEEILPGFSDEFPYIASCAECHRYPQPEVPWHWHNSLELFYMEKGELRYTTPQGVLVFPEGSGGLVNAGVLHTSCWKPGADGPIQLLHIFDPELLGGRAGSRIDRLYVRPLVHQSGMEILPIYPDSERNIRLLRDIRETFDIPETAFGYELLVRQRLCGIWLELVEMAEGTAVSGDRRRQSGEQIKRMMVYVHEHYGDHISVEELAATAHLSKRACFRAFQENLHMTPVEYIRSYRLQMACGMLAEGKYSVTEIAYRCGMGSSSYFGKVFREEKGCTPAQYRKKWRDSDK